MTMYRVKKNLARGEIIVPRGIIDPLEGFSAKAIDILIQRGAIAPVASPPISEIPRWITRAARLAEIGIITIGDLLEADTGTVATHMNVRPQTVGTWKRQLEKLLHPPAKEN